MSKHLGLDLGTNSIGWAYVDLTRTEKRKLRRKYQRELIFKNRISKKEATFFKIKNLISENIRTILLMIITVTLFLFSLIFAEFWQLFLNLGIGGLISILTLENKKK
jgi:hypothetical protein|tara:strand:- start:2066 stop:2386 length:321 start_codon:yes stop_codon:yes gene_type:complete